MYFLAIETSCDETAAAVFDETPAVLSNVVASQTDLHARFGGVVPEVAARAHLRQLLPIIDEALRQAGVTIDEIGAVAVMNTPGLVGALLVGVSAAKMLAIARDLPLIAVNHIEAHIYACRLGAMPTPANEASGALARVAGAGVGMPPSLGRDIFPCVGLVVSGGHTSLFHCRDALRFELLGATIDDAAGEAFDKVASILGLGFPGGPAVERAAQTGNPAAFSFPRSFLRDARLDFSFSGLKTAVLYAVRDLNPPLTDAIRNDVAASFQQAVIDVLVGKCRQALEQTGLRTLAVGGGVAANQSLRLGMQEMVEAAGDQLFIPPLRLCTDNAAMAAMAVEKWKAGLFAPLDLDAEPTYQPGASATCSLR